MKALVERSHRSLERPLRARPRLLLLAAVLLLFPAYVTPLWRMTMFAPQHPDGLRLRIYSYKLAGGHAGQDLRGINLLNHEIGMRELSTAEFTEFKWIPFALGGFALVLLRALLLGRTVTVVDLFVAYVYFGLFSLWSFGYKLYSYGHNLAATAPVKVPAFMPPLLGYRKLANVEVYSYPAAGAYALAAIAVALGLAVAVAWQEARAEEAVEARAAA